MRAKPAPLSGYRERVARHSSSACDRQDPRMDTLQLTWQMDGCTPGVDASTENPLARATDCLFCLGRPFSRLNKCFFVGADGTMRWLGIFVHSAGDRLLFFPGFAQPQTQVLAHCESGVRWDQPFQIDHLSLESDRRTWHLTAPKSIDHLGRLPTRKLGADRLHWFSMSAADAAHLRVVREETRVLAPTPPQDVDRRVQIFKGARENATFQIVRLNSDFPSLVEPTFLHFSVVVGPRGFSSPQNELLGLPQGSPFLPSTRPIEAIQAPIRLHRVLLSDNIELEITAANLPGDLQTPWLFAAPMPESRPNQTNTGE